VMYTDDVLSPNDDQLDRDALLKQMKPKPEAPAGPYIPYSLDGDGRQPPKVLPDPGTAAPVVGTKVPETGAVAGAGPYQSHHGSVAGYLQAAMGAYAPTVQAARSEQGAKTLAQNYITSLRPEIEKRGGKVGDIKNEKIQIDGKWVDLYRDIGGASEAQYLVDDGGGSAPMPGASAMLPMSTAAPVDPTVAAAGGSTYEDLLKKIKDALGPDGERQMLLQQMRQS
jgi:hypothetical protein